jgi:cytidylate kinase
MIITIGGKYGCGGKPIAQEAAKLLGYKCCDDEVITEAVKNSGVDLEEHMFQYFDESLGTAPVDELIRLSKLQKSHYASIVSSLALDTLPLDRKIAETQAKIFAGFADEGNCILLGRCADHYLGEREDVIRVFVTDEYDNRVARITEHFGIDAEHAINMIQRVDKRRDAYYTFFTHKVWGDIENYDLVLCCALWGIGGCAQLLKHAVKIKERQL